MILTIPRKTEYLTGEARFPEETPLFKFSPIIGGLTFYNNYGKLVAQLFKRDGAVTLSVADGGTLILKKKPSGEIVVEKPVAVKLDEMDNYDEGKERTIDGEIVFFGNAAEAQYEFFIRRKGEIKPHSLVQAVAHPLSECLVNIRVADGENLLLAVALCMATTML